MRGERPVGATGYWFWAEIPKCSTATPHSNEKESIKLLANNTQFPVGKSPHGHRHRITRTSVRHQFLGGTLRLLSLCLVLFVFCTIIVVIFTNYVAMARSSQGNGNGSKTRVWGSLRNANTINLCLNLSLPCIFFLGTRLLACLPATGGWGCREDDPGSRGASGSAGHREGPSYTHLPSVLTLGTSL